MPISSLKEFLKEKGVRFIIIHHSPAYTAQEIAALTHIRGKDLAKTVIVRLDGKMVMAVLPAPYQIDWDLLKRATGVQDARLAAEEDFKDIFPGCELGAMPPFGNLYGMEVYVAPQLTKEKEIAFNAGTHYELMKLDYEDFDRLVHPKVADFSRRVHPQAQSRTYQSMKSRGLTGCASVFPGPDFC